MAITLDAVTLPDLVIENEYEWSGVRAVAEHSLGGTPIIWEQENYGRPLDLTGGPEYGWVTRETLNDLQALAAVPGATYTLTYESDTYTVRFRHEETAISARPIIPRPNHVDADYYNNVVIRLMEV